LNLFLFKLAKVGLIDFQWFLEKVSSNDLKFFKKALLFYINDAYDQLYFEIFPLAQHALSGRFYGFCIK